jgi:hypothetical protein
MRPTSALLRTLIALPVLALTACAGDMILPLPAPGEPAYVNAMQANGFLHRVELSHVAPRTGDTLSIRSVVVNVAEERRVVSRICGMDVEGIELGFLGACDGYSTSRTLAPGDSVVTYRRDVLLSPAGAHAVRLRHLLNPEQWIEFDLKIR